MATDMPALSRKAAEKMAEEIKRKHSVTVSLEWHQQEIDDVATALQSVAHSDAERVKRLEDALAASEKNLAEVEQENERLLEYSRKVAGTRDVHSIYEVLDHLLAENQGLAEELAEHESESWCFNKSHRDPAQFAAIETALADAVKALREYDTMSVSDYEAVLAAAEKLLKHEDLTKLTTEETDTERRSRKEAGELATRLYEIATDSSVSWHVAVKRMADALMADAAMRGEV